MVGKLLAAVFAFILCAGIAVAQNCPANPNNLANGSTADATQVMANFNNLLNCADNNLAHNGANSDITSLSGLAAPLSRNRLVNGTMMIDQRNEGAAVSAASGSAQFVTDQWAFAFTGASTGNTAQQVSDAPARFKNSLRITIGTGSATVNASDSMRVRQYIEGQNIVDFGYGASGASPISISFWVKASVTGTYSVSLQNSAQNRSYVTTFLIGTANTWSQVVLPNISGDITGTWLTTNGAGLELGISLEAGSSVQTSTSNTWQSGNVLATNSSPVNLGATSGATFQVTGVQLEAGSAATAFDVHSYGAELALCQRYYEKSYDPGTAVATATGLGAIAIVITALPTGPLQGGTNDRYKVTKRATPTVTLYSPHTGASGKIYDANANADSASSPYDVGLSGFSWYASTAGSSGAVNMEAQWTADAGL